jgi:hypothetical protein
MSDRVKSSIATQISNAPARVSSNTMFRASEPKVT